MHAGWCIRPSRSIAGYTSDGLIAKYDRCVMGGFETAIPPYEAIVRNRDEEWITRTVVRSDTKDARQDRNIKAMARPNLSAAVVKVNYRPMGGGALAVGKRSRKRKAATAGWKQHKRAHPF